jgi:hypothetical protein
MKKSKQITIKRLQIYDRISYSSLIVAVVLAMIRSLIKNHLSVEVIKISLYVSVFLGLVFIFFALLKFIEKKKIERKTSNYDNF